MNGHLKAAHSFYGVTPCAQLNAAVLQWDSYAGSFFDEEIFDAPDDRLLSLRAIFRKPLREIPLAIEKGDGHHREADVRGRANGISGQDAQAAAIAGHGVFQRDLH